GREAPVAQVVESILTRARITARRDALGSVRARVRAARAERAPTLMLSAHTDEIALVVSKLDGAFLRVDAVGGIDTATVLGREVIVHAAEGPLPGVIATIPPHLTTASDRRKLPALRDLFVDVGLTEANLRARVRPGDRISFDTPLRRLMGERAAGKSLDDRAGVLCALEAMRLLAAQPAPVDVVAVFSVQEEVGLRGALTSAFALAPDAAIAIDVGFGDQPDVPESGSIKLGGGPSIGIGPSLHPGLRERLKEVAKAQHIGHQFDLMPGRNGTDAWAIETARGSVPCALLSIPLRHMHSTAEVVDLRDIRETARLIAAFAQGLDARTMEGWRHAAF
ncbi:MAG TPA: M20/M25/M40 family metallo-hydrolase, partial [Limnochordia bacterium]|nr:M20/M25/M40 family metallo-hydrolase [Limnochordia bacterium]